MVKGNKKRHFFDVQVGGCVAAIRRARKLEQAELAKIMGLTQSSVSRLERGVASFNMAQFGKVVAILDLTPQEFFARLDAVEKTKELLET